MVWNGSCRIKELDMHRVLEVSLLAIPLALVACADVSDVSSESSSLQVATTEQSLGTRFWDFGKTAESILKSSSMSLFGIGAPLTGSAPKSVANFRNPTQAASAQVLLAEGLTASYVTRSVANAADMLAFWPNDSTPTHLIFCIEGGRETIGTNGDGSAKLNPSVQAVALAGGEVHTILRGMSGCDGIRRTPWGTILATEEEDDGGAYEIIQPLDVWDAVVLDRASGAVSSEFIVKRSALPTMAWEGLEVLPSGVVVGGDELRPGTARPDVDGGAIFKFVPASPRISTTAITDLAESPLTSGSVYAMQVSCVGGRQQSGQGCEVGNAAWIPVSARLARSDAFVQGATGYYRPEDLHLDPRFVDVTNRRAVRFCWTNTGNSGAANFAEVMCAVDRSPDTATPTQQSVVVSRFIEGDEDFNAFDNLEFQKPSGNLYVIEDNNNGDVFACLPDGADRDRKSDGCVKVLSVADSSAEPTGFTFTTDGRRAFLSIQHSNDANMPQIDDYGTDDVLMITGFQTFGLR
jgi:hypothetical protein